MKIGIDYSSAASKQRSGVGNYTYNLVREISELDDKNQYYLFVKSKVSFTNHLKPNFKIFSRNSLIRWFTKLDLFHGTDFKLISTRAKKNIITIHDLGSCINDDFMSKDFQELTKRKIQKSVEKSDIIITPTKSVKYQLEELYPGTKGKICAIYHGISDDIRFIEDAERINTILAKYKINKPYLLFVGNIENRKNIKTLLLAFNDLIKQKKIEHKLVLVGKPGWGFEKIQGVYRKLQLEHDVKFIGWIENDDIPALYSASELFIYPSFYEGFGFPILEAMKCRVPVIASDIPTHREIASNAAHFVSPHDSKAIADAILSLLNDQSKREFLVTIGSEHVKLFTWQKTANEMLKIYSSLSC